MRVAMPMARGVTAAERDRSQVTPLFQGPSLLTDMREMAADAAGRAERPARRGHLRPRSKSQLSCDFASGACVALRWRSAAPDRDGAQRALTMHPEHGQAWSTAADPQMPRRAPRPPPGSKSQLSCDFISGACVGLRRRSAAPDRRAQASARPHDTSGARAAMLHAWPRSGGIDHRQGALSAERDHVSLTSAVCGLMGVPRTHGVAGSALRSRLGRPHGASLACLPCVSRGAGAVAAPNKPRNYCKTANGARGAHTVYTVCPR